MRSVAAVRAPGARVRLLSPGAVPALAGILEGSRSACAGHGGGPWSSGRGVRTPEANAGLMGRVVTDLKPWPARGGPCAQTPLIVPHAGGLASGAGRALDEASGGEGGSGRQRLPVWRRTRTGPAHGWGVPGGLHLSWRGPGWTVCGPRPPAPGIRSSSSHSSAPAWRGSSGHAWTVRAVPRLPERYGSWCCWPLLERPRVILSPGSRSRRS